MELRGGQELRSPRNPPDEEVRVLRAEGAVDTAVEVVISYRMYMIQTTQFKISTYDDMRIDQEEIEEC